MPYSIVYAPLAIEDLDAVWSYLAVECGNETAAIKTVSAIMTRLELLSDFPKAGTPLDAKCIIHSSYRFIASSHYLAFYRIGNGCVYIDRILDGRSDYLRKLLELDDPATDLYV